MGFSLHGQRGCIGISPVGKGVSGYSQSEDYRFPYPSLDERCFRFNSSMLYLFTIGIFFGDWGVCLGVFST